MHHVLCTVFWVKHHITEVVQPPYYPYSVPCDFWLFPKLKSPLKGKTLQIIDKIQENMTGKLMAIGGTVWGPKVPTLKGTEAWLSCAMFLVSCIFFNKCFYFSCYMTGYPFIVLTVGTMLYSGFLELTYMTPMKIFTYWVTTLHFPAPTSSPWQPLLNSLLIWVWLLYIPQKKKKSIK